MTTDTNNWASGPLHAALVTALPAFVKEPFSCHPKVNVPELKEALGRSHETVYKWLRSNRLTPRAVEEILAVSRLRKNRTALTKFGRDLPKTEDFHSFVFTSLK